MDVLRWHPLASAASATASTGPGPGQRLRHFLLPARCGLYATGLLLVQRLLCTGYIGHRSPGRPTFVHQLDDHYCCNSRLVVLCNEFPWKMGPLSDGRGSHRQRLRCHPRFASEISFGVHRRLSALLSIGELGQSVLKTENTFFCSRLFFHVVADAVARRNKHQHGCYADSPISFRPKPDLW